jgi:hypothetical protein
LLLANTKRVDLSLIYPPRNKESVLRRKQGLVAKALDKKKYKKLLNIEL